MSKEYRKAYYAKNRERLTEEARSWRLANKEHISAYNKMYYKNRLQKRLATNTIQYQSPIPEIGKRNVLVSFFRRLFRKANQD